jgi:uncharacterized protein YbjT (DUF2867 family)
MVGDMKTTVLVTGPTGKVGRRLIPLLARRGVTVRPAGRSRAGSAAAPPVAARPGIEPVHFDWTDERTYAAARKGVDAIYLVTGSIPLPEHGDRVRTLLDGAREAGVERVVLLSAYGVDQAPPGTPLRDIELAVESSGMPYTILRAGAFMQNFSEPHFIRAAESIRERDEIATPGGDGLVSWVSTEDIGAVAAAALTGDGHQGKAYALTGPEALTLTEVAGHISAALGRRIRYVETDRRALRDELLAAGAPPEIAELNSTLYTTAMTSGAFGALNDEILEVTGRPPVSFAEFAVGAAGAWRR